MSKLIVKTPTIAQYTGVFAFYLTQGWSVEGTKYETYGAKTKLYIDNAARNITFSTIDKTDKPNVPSLTFAQFSAVTGCVEVTPAPPRTATLALNSRYSAVVDYSSRTVKVGDESISFDKIAELGDLLDA